MTHPHPTTPLILQIAQRVLREQQDGRSVDPSRITWAREVIALNPQHFPAAVATP